MASAPKKHTSVVKAGNPRKLKIMCTAYCGCGHCCGYEWGLTIFGRSKYLSLGDIHSPAGTRHPLLLRQSWPETIKRLQNFDLTALRPKNICVKPREVREDLKPGLFCRYWTHTRQVGMPYTGVTSTGVLPQQARTPLLSTQQLAVRPHRIPIRLLLPWKAPPAVGTVAADTTWFPFQTQLHVPGYGLGVVQDHGSAIRGGLHVDLFHMSHRDALEWGRRELEVLVVPPGKHVIDAHNIDPKLKPIAKFALDAWGCIFGLRH